MTRLSFAVLLAMTPIPVFGGQPPHPPADANDLALEVAALQTIHHLNLTVPQLQMLAQFRKDNPLKDRNRDAARIGPEYRKALVSLRDAYARNDPAKIAECAEKHDALAEKENPDLDDAVYATELTRRKTTEVIRQLSARQAAGYYGFFSEDWKGPGELLSDALQNGRKAADADWASLRERTADDVAWLLAGCDDDTFKDARAKVVAFLDRARKLSDSEFKSQQVKREQAIQSLVAKVGPIEVLRHSLERDIAELLTNPRLGAAIEARLAHAKK
jgi:hypothetical protein